MNPLKPTIRGQTAEYLVRTANLMAFGVLEYRDLLGFFRINRDAYALNVFAQGTQFY